MHNVVTWAAANGPCHLGLCVCVCNAGAAMPATRWRWPSRRTTAQRGSASVSDQCSVRPSLPFLAFSLLITASHCFSLPFKLPFLVISLLITAYHCFSLPFTAFQAAFPCVFTAYHCLSLRFHCFSLPFKLPFHWVSTRAARTPASDELHRP